MLNGGSCGEKSMSAVQEKSSLLMPNGRFWETNYALFSGELLRKFYITTIFQISWEIFRPWALLRTPSPKPNNQTGVTFRPTYHGINLNWGKYITHNLLSPVSQTLYILWSSCLRHCRWHNASTITPRATRSCMLSAELSLPVQIYNNKKTYTAFERCCPTSSQLCIYHSNCTGIPDLHSASELQEATFWCTRQKFPHLHLAPHTRPLGTTYEASVMDSTPSFGKPSTTADRCPECSNAAPPQRLNKLHQWQKSKSKKEHSYQKILNRDTDA